MNTIVGKIRQDLADRIYYIFNEDGGIAWYYRKKFSLPAMECPEEQFGAFSHILFDNNQQNSSFFGDAFGLAVEICQQENLKINKLHRIYANLYLNVIHTDEMIKNEIHHDSDNPDCKTILYYINDSDGDTLFYDDDKKLIDKQTPQQGKYIVFDSNKLHGAGIPIKNKYRMVLNIVFE